MTEEELIARLRAYREHDERSGGMVSFEVDECIAAADRIEALTAELAKAVEALKDMCLEFRQADLPYGSAAYAKARATLAEIKGESHE